MNQFFYSLSCWPGLRAGPSACPSLFALTQSTDSSLLILFQSVGIHATPNPVFESVYFSVATSISLLVLIFHILYFINWSNLKKDKETATHTTTKPPWVPDLSGPEPSPSWCRLTQKGRCASGGWAPARADPPARPAFPPAVRCGVRRFDCRGGAGLARVQLGARRRKPADRQSS